MYLSFSEYSQAEVLTPLILVCSVFLNNMKLFSAAIYSKKEHKFFGPFHGFSATWELGTICSALSMPCKNLL
jgi:hypothetical protein